MATTVAHGLIGISIYCVVNVALPERRRFPMDPAALLGAAAVANIPDFDMVLGLVIFQSHTVLHGEITHSLSFALVCAVLAGFLGHHWGWHKELGFMTFLMVASHSVVDALTGPQPGLYPSAGSSLLWPFVAGRIHMPLTVFQGVQHNDLFPDALFTAAWELIILSTPTLVAIRLARRHSKALLR